MHFRFNAKLKDLRTSKSLQSQKQQTISHSFPLLFPWLGILRAELNDIGYAAVSPYVAATAANRTTAVLFSKIQLSPANVAKPCLPLLALLVKWFCRLLSIAFAANVIGTTRKRCFCRYYTIEKSALSGQGNIWGKQLNHNMILQNSRLCY